MNDHPVPPGADGPSGRDAVPVDPTTVENLRAQLRALPSASAESRAAHISAAMAAFDPASDPVVPGSVTHLGAPKPRAHRSTPTWLIAAASVVVLIGIGIGIGLAGSGSEDAVTTADSAAVSSSGNDDSTAPEAASSRVAESGATDEAEAAPSSKTQPSRESAGGLDATSDPALSIPDFGEFADDDLLRALIDGSPTTPFAADAVTPSPTTDSPALTCLSAKPTWQPLGTATVGGRAVLIVVVHAADDSSSRRLVVDQQTCTTRPL